MDAIRRHPYWQAGGALLAALALVTQAALLSAAAPIHVHAYHLLAAAAGMCAHTGSDGPGGTPDAPPQHDRHDGCCVLCSSPGLDGSAVALAWHRPAPVCTPPDAPCVFGPFPGAIERLPGEARAPPPPA